MPSLTSWTRRPCKASLSGRCLALGELGARDGAHEVAGERGILLSTTEDEGGALVVFRRFPGIACAGATFTCAESVVATFVVANGARFELGPPSPAPTAARSASSPCAQPLSGPDSPLEQEEARLRGPLPVSPPVRFNIDSHDYSQTCVVLSNMVSVVHSVTSSQPQTPSVQVWPLGLSAHSASLAQPQKPLVQAWPMGLLAQSASLAQPQKPESVLHAEEPLPAAAHRGPAGPAPPHDSGPPDHQ